VARARNKSATESEKHRELNVVIWAVGSLDSRIPALLLFSLYYFLCGCVTLWRIFQLLAGRSLRQAAEAALAAAKILYRSGEIGGVEFRPHARRE
jgi:hypothetical protein